MAVNYGALPFLEALEFFRNKLNLPTQRWDDLLGAAHDRAFVVAGALQADLLMDLRAAVDKAMAEGTTLETFRKDFKKIVAERGWTGWTGEGTKAGLAWRTRIIYDTNLFTSYSAGRYRQMKDIAHVRPWWRYRHSPASVHPRPEHQAWDGLILRHDDPWWSAHTPPNGWGCKCYIETLADRDMKRLGLEPTPKEKIPYNDLDPKTGLPQGVDKGWDYPPGASVNRDLVDLIAQKKAGWPPELAAEFDALLRERASKQPFGWREALNDPGWRYRLDGFKNGAGWNERGGLLLRDEKGNVTGRTKWMAKEQWWADYVSSHATGRISAQKVAAVIGKALSGERLGAGENRFVEWLYDYTNEQKAMQAELDDLVQALPDNSNIILSGLKKRFAEHVKNEDAVNETIAAIMEEFYTNKKDGTVSEANNYLIGELKLFLDG